MLSIILQREDDLETRASPLLDLHTIPLLTLGCSLHADINCNCFAELPESLCITGREGGLGATVPQDVVRLFVEGATEGLLRGGKYYHGQACVWARLEGKKQEAGV